MISINGKEVELGRFPDGTLSMKCDVSLYDFARNPWITWNYEDDSEYMALSFLRKHARDAGADRCLLSLPYIPNARQDRVKTTYDVFSLKYFAEMINALEFKQVKVLDPHSPVSEALFNNVRIVQPTRYIKSVISELKNELDNITVLYPDEGSSKRYSDLVKMPYCFGVKHRDWESGQIQSLEVLGDKSIIEGKNILIIDDICSRGGTFYFSAKELKQRGVKDIYLYITHCEKSIFKGDLLTSGLIKKVFTTNSIFKQEYIPEEYKSMFSVLELEGEYS